MNKFFKYIKDNLYHLKYLLLLFISSYLYFLLNRPIGDYIYNFKTMIDEMIPLIPWTVLIYHTWYPSMILILLYFVGHDKTLYYRTVFATFIGDLICLTTYVFFQNEVVREPILGTDIFSKLLLYTRNQDNPFNGLPSMHVTSCAILILAALHSNLPTKTKVFLIALQCSIVISTMTTRQHYFLDCVTGIIIGVFCFTLLRNKLFIKSE